jgi:hypothetical protein
MQKMYNSWKPLVRGFPDNGLKMSNCRKLLVPGFPDNGSIADLTFLWIVSNDNVLVLDDS